MQYICNQPCSPAGSRRLGDPALLGEDRGLPDVDILSEGLSEEEDPFPVKATSHDRPTQVRFAPCSPSRHTRHL